MLTGTVSSPLPRPPDVLGSVLRGHQPLQVPAHLHRGHSGHVQGQEETRDAPPHLRHHRHLLQEHDAGWAWSLMNLCTHSLTLTHSQDEAYYSKSL